MGMKSGTRMDVKRYKIHYFYTVSAITMFPWIFGQCAYVHMYMYMYIQPNEMKQHNSNITKVKQIHKHKIVSTRCRFIRVHYVEKFSFKFGWEPNKHRNIVLKDWEDEVRIIILSQYFFLFLSIFHSVGQHSLYVLSERFQSLHFSYPMSQLENETGPEFTIANFCSINLATNFTLFKLSSIRCCANLT